MKRLGNREKGGREEQEGRRHNARGAKERDVLLDELEGRDGLDGPGGVADADEGALAPEELEVVQEPEYMRAQRVRFQRPSTAATADERDDTHVSLPTPS